MRHFFQKISQLFWLVLLIFPASSFCADEKTEKIDKIFAQWDTTTSPGVALAIIKDNQIIYERGYGMAKIEDGIVMTPSKIFDIASVSKQFTATCLAILIQQGKVSLEEDIRKYFPEMPQYEKPILVKHLIYHTSGLRDYDLLLALAGFRPESDCPTIEEALEIIFKQKKLNHSPGEEFSYTNIGYFLLGQIIEKVSGKSLNAFAQENLFKPLGMTHTFFQEDHTQIIQNLASGYEPSGKGYKFCMSNWDETGDGNVYTSVEDLYLWDQGFYNYKLGKDLMDSLQVPGVLNNGKILNYTFGLCLDEHKGLKIISHGGSWAGYRAEFLRFPEQKFSVICLANFATAELSSLCLKVADVYLADFLKEKSKEEKKNPENISLSPLELEEKVGNYQDQKSGMWFSVSLKEKQLILTATGEELTLTPISKLVFEVLPLDISIEFQTDANGKLSRAFLKASDDESCNLVKASTLSPLTAEQLEEYTGAYTSEEIPKAQCRFLLEKDHLVLKCRGTNLLPTAMDRDKFILDDSLAIEFIRDKEKVIGFKLMNERARGIEFVKK